MCLKTLKTGRKNAPEVWEDSFFRPRLTVVDRNGSSCGHSWQSPSGRGKVGSELNKLDCGPNGSGALHKAIERKNDYRKGKLMEHEKRQKAKQVDSVNGRCLTPSSIPGTQHDVPCLIFPRECLKGKTLVLEQKTKGPHPSIHVEASELLFQTRCFRANH